MPKTSPAPAFQDANSQGSPSEHIHANMRISEIVTLVAGSQKLLSDYGLHCAGCSFNMQETLREGFQIHGFSEETLSDLLKDLNTLLEEGSAQDLTITVTKDAAVALRGILQEEKKEGHVLCVSVDDGGGFCMEFHNEPAIDERVFFHSEEPDVRVCASEITLKRIGGAVIDFREGRFKLDLAEQSSGACCKDGGECKCKG